MIADTVAGIFVRKQSVLVEKRRQDDPADPGLVVIPGGHSNQGEPLGDALKREMKEELGVTVRKIRLVQKRLYTASDGERQRIHYFHVLEWNGRIRSKEAEKVYWESNLANLSDSRERRIVRSILKESRRLDTHHGLIQGVDDNTTKRIVYRKHERLHQPQRPIKIVRDQSRIMECQL